MKTRIDFVSNSSSCSFIIEDIKMFYDKMVELFGEDVDMFTTDFFNGISMQIQVSSNDRNFLESLDGVDSSNIYSWNDACVASNVPFASIKAFVSLLAPKATIAFECDDYDQDAVTNLSILKKACDKLGIKVDSSSSERDLMFDTDDRRSLTVFAKLASIAFE